MAAGSSCDSDGEVVQLATADRFQVGSVAPADLGDCVTCLSILTRLPAEVGTRRLMGVTS